MEALLERKLASGGTGFLRGSWTETRVPRKDILRKIALFYGKQKLDD